MTIGVNDYYKIYDIIKGHEPLLVDLGQCCYFCSSDGKNIHFQFISTCEIPCPK